MPKIAIVNLIGDKPSPIEKGKAKFNILINLF
jgi:hypothetical protein